MLPSVPMTGTALRDLLARERTFLSFIRTAGYSFGVGMGISTLFEGPLVKVSAIVFVVIGILLTIFAAISFTRFALCIRYELYTEMSKLSTWTVSLLALVVACVTIALLVEGERGG